MAIRRSRRNRIATGFRAPVKVDEMLQIQGKNKELLQMLRPTEGARVGTWSQESIR